MPKGGPFGARVASPGPVGWRFVLEVSGTLREERVRVVGCRGNCMWQHRARFRAVRTLVGVELAGWLAVAAWTGLDGCGPCGGSHGSGTATMHLGPQQATVRQRTAGPQLFCSAQSDVMRPCCYGGRPLRGSWCMHLLSEAEGTTRHDGLWCCGWLDGPRLLSSALRYWERRLGPRPFGMTRYGPGGSRGSCDSCDPDSSCAKRFIAYKPSITQHSPGTEEQRAPGNSWAGHRAVRIGPLSLQTASKFARTFVEAANCLFALRY